MRIALKRKFDKLITELQVDNVYYSDIKGDIPENYTTIRDESVKAYQWYKTSNDDSVYIVGYRDNSTWSYGSTIDQRYTIGIGNLGKGRESEGYYLLRWDSSGYGRISNLVKVDPAGWDTMTAKEIKNTYSDRPELSRGVHASIGNIESLIKELQGTLKKNRSDLRKLQKLLDK